MPYSDRLVDIYVKALKAEVKGCAYVYVVEVRICAFMCVCVCTICMY